MNLEDMPIETLRDLAGRQMAERDRLRREMEEMDGLVRETLAAFMEKAEARRLSTVDPSPRRDGEKERA